MNKKLDTRVYFEESGLKAYLQKNNTNSVHVYFRSLDACGLITNLHSFLLPFELSHRKNRNADVLRVYLTETQDVLCPIGKDYKPLLNQWKASWKSLMEAIYNRKYLLMESETGNLWFKDPQKLLNEIPTYFPVPLSMQRFRTQVCTHMRSLLELKENLQNGYFIKSVRSLLERLNQDYSKITLICSHLSAKLVLQVLNKYPPATLKTYCVQFIDPYINEKVHYTSAFESKVHFLEPSPIRSSTKGFLNLTETRNYFKSIGSTIIDQSKHTLFYRANSGRLVILTPVQTQ